MNKPVIVIAALVVAVGAVAMAAPAFGKKTPRTEIQSAFGIKSTESVFGYQRQAIFTEISKGRYRVAPPRPEAAFDDYALSSDPVTNKVCAVYAATEDEPAITHLKSELAETYGEPTVTPEQGWRWAKDSHFVEISDKNGRYEVSWNFTGDCHTKAG